MSKLTLAALVAGLALSLASPVVVQAQPKDADSGAAPAQSKKGITPKADTRTEKAKAASAAPKDADAGAAGPDSKKGITPKADTRSEKAKSTSAVPKDADPGAAGPESKKKK